MTEERDNLLKIFDEIINEDQMWDEIHFKRVNGALTIVGKGRDLIFKYSEDNQY